MILVWIYRVSKKGGGGRLPFSLAGWYGFVVLLSGTPGVAHAARSTTLNDGNSLTLVPDKLPFGKARQNSGHDCLVANVGAVGESGWATIGPAVMGQFLWSRGKNLKNAQIEFGFSIPNSDMPEPQIFKKARSVLR